MHPHTAGQKMNGNLLAQKKLLSAVTPSRVPLLCSKWHEFFGLSVSLSLSLCLSVFLSFCLISFLCVCLSVSISFSVLIKWQNIRDYFRLAVDKNVLTWAECMSVCLCLCLITLSLFLSLWVNVWLVCFCFYILLNQIIFVHLSVPFCLFLCLFKTNLFVYFSMSYLELNRILFF